MLAAAIKSNASSHLTLLKPPLPLALWYLALFIGSFCKFSQAFTKSPPAASFSMLNKSIKAPRIIGYLTRIGLYKYQEYEIPL